VSRHRRAAKKCHRGSKRGWQPRIGMTPKSPSKPVLAAFLVDASLLPKSPPPPQPDVDEAPVSFKKK